jgi:pimeloyl-ACP methyl ester carboxylesterase
MAKYSAHLDDPASPSLLLLALEGRAFLEMSCLLPSWPLLQKAPKGDGHRVIVFPGLSTNDMATAPLRYYLKSLNYQVSGWNQGLNFGPRHGVMETARQNVLAAFRDSGEKVSLVGWSLGGIYARELAKEMPEAVRCVVTLGCPFAASPKSTNLWRLFELTSGKTVEQAAHFFDLVVPPALPTCSIYSETDGIVAWRASVQPGPLRRGLENVSVIASHLGLPVNPAALWVVADRLAQRPDQWQAFKKPVGVPGLAFPNTN